MIQLNKKAAFEMSIGTVVIIVLAMTMLILGITLIRGIFTGASEVVDITEEGVRDEIRGLFQDEQERLVVRLSGDSLRARQGEEASFGIGIRNTGSGAQSERFSYEVELNDDRIQDKCGVSAAEAENWIRFGSGSFDISPGNVQIDRVLFQLPENSPICTTRYLLVVRDSNNNVYASRSFFLDIRSGGIF